MLGHRRGVLLLPWDAKVAARGAVWGWGAQQREGVQLWQRFGDGAAT